MSDQERLHWIKYMIQSQGCVPRQLHKTNNPYSAWIAIGTYGSFNDALAAVLRKKKQGSIAVQIVDSNGMTVYSS